MRCQFCHNLTPDAAKSKARRTADDVLDSCIIVVIGDKKAEHHCQWRGNPCCKLTLIDAQKSKSYGHSTTIDTWCGQPFTREEPFFSKLPN